jgi:putative transposase
VEASTTATERQLNSWHRYWNQQFNGNLCRECPTKLVNGRSLKSIAYYWKKIAEYQSTLNKYGLKTSRRLGRMYVKWRRQIKHYIDARVRGAVEWLYDVGVSTIKVGYPKGIAQENGDFDNVNVWTYGLLLRRIREVAEEYGMRVIYVDEAGTSSRCPLHGDGCGIRITEGYSNARGWARCLTPTSLRHVIF